MITTIYHSPLGDIMLAATARGLTGLWFCDGEGESAVRAAGAPVFDMHRGVFEGAEPDEEIEGCDAVSGARPMSASDPANSAAVSVLERSWAWLNAYFAGQDPRWVPPMDLHPTDFEHAVWVALLGLGYGRATTCEALAAALSDRVSHGGDAASVRAAALACPVKVVVPSHRLVDLLADDLAARGRSVPAAAVHPERPAFDPVADAEIDRRLRNLEKRG